MSEFSRLCCYCDDRFYPRLWAERPACWRCLLGFLRSPTWCAYLILVLTLTASTATVHREIPPGAWFSPGTPNWPQGGTRTFDDHWMSPWIYEPWVYDTFDEREFYEEQLEDLRRELEIQLRARENEIKV